MNQVNFARVVRAVTGTNNGTFATNYNSGGGVVYDLECRWLQILNNGTDGTSTNAKAIYVKRIQTLGVGSDDGTYEFIIPPLDSYMVIGITNINQVRVRCVDGTAGYNVFADAIN